jgi:septum site-determining protein MinC
LKTKQYTAKIFEVELEDESSFISFFDKNSLFFQNTLIVIQGKETESIKKYLDDKELKYIFNLEIPVQKRQKTNVEVSPKVEEKKSEKIEIKVEKKKTSLKVLDKLIRSGQEVKVDGDLLLLNRVNSGGSIIVNGTLIVTQVVDGSIRCSGDFMMLQASSKANILFHEVEVDNKLLQDKLNRIELIDNEIIITPALKEKNWV